MHARISVLVAAAGIAVGLAGCGGSPRAPLSSPARIEHGPHGTRIVLSASGAQRIGLRTARTHSARGPMVAVPASALIYDPSGKTYAFIAVQDRTYAEVHVRVARIDGDTALLKNGPRVGDQVVSTGAEELYGVQTGVLGQS